MAEQGIHRDGQTGAVSEIQETGPSNVGQSDMESGSKEINQMTLQENPVEHVGHEEGISELEKIEEGSQKVSGEEPGQSTEDLEERTGREAEEGVVDKTKEGTEAEVGEKRKRPDTEKMGASKEAKKGRKGAKRAKKPEDDTEKPATKERKAKSTAKEKIQAGEKTASTKKRGVGRPRKSSSSVKKDDGADIEPVDTGVQGEAESGTH